MNLTLSHLDDVGRRVLIVWTDPLLDDDALVVEAPEGAQELLEAPVGGRPPVPDDHGPSSELLEGPPQRSVSFFTDLL